MGPLRVPAPRGVAPVSVQSSTPDKLQSANCFIWLKGSGQRKLLHFSNVVIQSMLIMCEDEEPSGIG